MDTLVWLALAGAGIILGALAVACIILTWIRLLTGQPEPPTFDDRELARIRRRHRRDSTVFPRSFIR